MHTEKGWLIHTYELKPKVLTRKTTQYGFHKRPYYFSTPAEAAKHIQLVLEKHQHVEVSITPIANITDASLQVEET